MHLPPANTFALHLLDVGQGESILLDLPNGDFALVDAGPARAKSIVLEEVQRRIDDKRRFRFAALTHWDADHVGALSAVLRRHKPCEMVLPSIDLGLIERLCAHHEKHIINAQILELREIINDLEQLWLGARQTIPNVGEGIEIWALSPTKTVHKRIETAAKNPERKVFERLRNEASLALWIRAFGRTFLLPGEVNADMASEMEFQFGGPIRPGHVPHDDPRVDWMKLGHHGSETGTNAELLRRFAHDAFVASASHRAHYNHPHPRVLHLVRETGGVAMCTRLGKGCQLSLQEPARYPSNDPSWVEAANLRNQPPVNTRCYSTISVRVSPDGQCAISGAVAERPDCPYGGPPSGALFM